MARCLHVKAGIITNVVEYGAATPPAFSDQGEDIVPAATGLESVGQAFDAVTAKSIQARIPASASLDSTEALGKALRAEAAVVIDEINSLRQWVTSFKAAMAAATTLADLKTRVAALTSLPNRTLAQAKTAIQDKINTGVVDA